MLERFEKNNLIIAGVDESGVGCVSGSVFAASLILPNDYHNKILNDSKKMSKKNRELVYDDIINNAIAYKVSSVSPDVIDDINILQATYKAMDNSIRNMKIGAEYLIIDGNRFIKDYFLEYETIVKGDGKYLSIAGASVLAKVEKDREMLAIHEKYPMYGWDTNSGYGTKKHIEAIKEYGFTEYHRKSYKVNLDK